MGCVWNSWDFHLIFKDSSVFLGISGDSLGSPRISTGSRRVLDRSLRYHRILNESFPTSWDLKAILQAPSRFWRITHKFPRFSTRISTGSLGILENSLGYHRTLKDPCRPLARDPFRIVLPFQGDPYRGIYPQLLSDSLLPLCPKEFHLLVVVFTNPDPEIPTIQSAFN